MFHNPMLTYSKRLLAWNTLIYSKVKVGAYARPNKGPDAVSDRGARHELDPLRGAAVTNADSRLRAFQLQQHSYMLLELELPRLLAPDLPSNCIR